MTQDFAADASITKRIGRIFSLMAGLLAVLLISGTAIYAQNLTKFGVAKTITGPTGAPALTNLNFGVNANCTPSAVAPNQIINYGIGAGAITFGAPASATCTVTETTKPPLPANAQEYCAKLGLVAFWAQQTYSLNGGPITTTPPSFIVSTPALLYNSVTINNRWVCQQGPKGQLNVRKSVSGPKGSPALPSLGFGVNVNCSPAVTPANVIVFASSGGASFTPVLGANCTITEAPQPALPANTQEFCAAQGGTAVWDAPVYTPNGTTTPPTVNIGSTPQNVHIANTWRCKPVEKSKLTVRKIVAGPQGAPALTNLNFGVNANCTPAMTPSTLVVNNSVGSVTFTVVTGAVCTVSESATMPAFPAIATEYCLGQGGSPVWDQPIYTPNGNTTPPTVTVSSASFLVSITNKWRCKQNESVKLEVRKKVKGPQNAPILSGLSSGLSFPVTANCTPATTPALMYIPAGGSVFFSVQLGAVCTVTEGAPPTFPPAIVEYCATTGGTPQWDPPVYVPAGNTTPPTITVSGPTTVVQITNSWSCKPVQKRKLEVRKVLTGPAGAPSLGNLNFAINANCTPAVASPNQVISVANPYTYAVQNGATCTITESSTMPTFPPNAVEYCLGQGGAPSWNAPIYNPVGTATPSTVTVNMSGMGVTIRNSWRCVPNPPRTLTVRKTVTGPPGVPPLGALNFGVTANCTPVTSPSNQTVTSGGSVTFNVQAGANCTVTESSVMPAFPPSAVQLCANSGGVPEWNLPMYAPNGTTTPPTVTISAPNTLVLITNSWGCKKLNGQINLTKIVQGPTAQLPNMTFTINANCTPAASVGSVPIMTTYPHGATAGGAIVAPVGANCTLNEVQPPVNSAMTAFCGNNSTAVWEPFVPVNITITSAPQNLTVTNKWKCVPKTGQLEIIKSFTTTQTAVQWPATNWTINTNCTPTGSATSVTVNTSASGNAVITGSYPNIISVPVGANCTIEEPTSSLPAFPSWITAYCGNAVNGGGSPQWNVPSYTYNGQTTTTPLTFGVTPGIHTVTVNNGWSCGSNAPSVQIEVFKNVEAPPSTVALPPSFSAIYGIQTNCTTTSTPGSVNVTAQSGGMGGGVGYFTVPSGANCNLTEPVLPSFPASANTYCTNFGGGGVPVWEAPTYVPTSSFTAGANISNISVTNKWKCVMNHPWFLSVIKTVAGPAGAPPLPSLPYVISRNCTGGLTSSASLTGAVTVNAATISSSTYVGGLIPVGAHCTLSEIQPPLPANAVAYCANQSPAGIATWNAPAYSLPMPVSGDFPANNKTVTVTNSWFCLSTQKVAPPKKKKKPKFKFNIGIGVGGGGGDKPKPPRDVPNGP